MLKTYISHVELSIRTLSGRRITFEPVSNGGSMFRSNNIYIQDELESHPLFGKSFRLDSASKKAAEEEIANESEENTEAPVLTEPAEEPVKEVKDVEVSGIADAKDYLADNYGIMRTQMRTKESIRKFAEINGVNFIGL